MQNGKSSKSSPLEVATLVTTVVLTFPILALAYLLHWLTGVPWATEEIDRLGELRLFLDKMDQYLRGANIVLSPPALEATNLLEFWRKRCVSHCGPPPIEARSELWLMASLIKAVRGNSGSVGFRTIFPRKLGLGSPVLPGT